MTYSCLICQNQKLFKVYEQGSYRIMKCPNCGFGVLDPYPTIEQANTIYSPDYFDDKKSPDFIKDATRKYNYVNKHLQASSKILYFGGGVGDFVGVAKKGGYQLYAYDVSTYAMEHVHKTFNIPTYTPPLSVDLFSKSQFDAIVAFDVIEHLPNFREVLNFFYVWLTEKSEPKQSGKLFMTMPNIDSWDTKLMGKYSYGYKKIPQHINYFSPQSISIVAKEAGFTVDEIKLLGFERSLDFVFSKLKLERLRHITHQLGIANLTFYYPMHDMMVSLSKNND